MSNTEAVSAPTLVIRRTFNAERKRVFAAWTDPQIIKSWFGGPETRVYDAAFDARDGGHYRIAMKSSEGEDFIVTGVITEFKEPERLAYTFTWQEDDPKDEHETFVRVEFTERGNQTDMVFTHERFSSEASRDRHEAGWNASFDKFAALL
jgi:uncharacterized protein YndB with AHSA1/START domain